VPRRDPLTRFVGALILTLVLAAIACGSGAGCGRSGAVTKRVAVLGYAKTPSVAVVTVGTAELVAPSVASLRSSGAATVVGEEPTEPDLTTPQMCARVRAKHAEIDEVIFIEALAAETADITCIQERCDPPSIVDPHRELPKCDCIKKRYTGGVYKVTTRMAAYRASTCELVRTGAMPTAIGQSVRHDIDFDADSAKEEGFRNNRQFDLDQARTLAVAALARTAPSFDWTFPRANPIVSATTSTAVIGAVLPEGDYLLRSLPFVALNPGVHATTDGHSTTLRLTDRLPKPEPGDELHAVVDMRRTAAYLGVGGGLLRAHGESYGVASSTLAFRFAFDRLPLITEVQLAGDVIPTLESARAMLGGAAGLRLPFAPFAPFAPIAFGELGLGQTYQGQHGGRAITGYLGAGAGLELAFTQWFFTTTIRYRWYAMDDWEDSQEHAVDVAHPDSRWSTTMLELGVGGRF
jgi:hypothetical protein